MARQPTTDQNARAPGLLRIGLECCALWEWGAGLALLPFLPSGPPGDGHPVLVFPGLAGGDATTRVIRSFLKDRGYAPYAWEQGLNFGPRPGVVEACMQRVRQLRESHGRSVSLVGWSLGGIYAREIAKMMPDEVRSVITLGTPFSGGPHLTNAWRLFQLLNGAQDVDQELLDSLRATPPVPTTSIYSRTDGIVAWQCSLETEGERSENIEVVATHCGMGLNPVALLAVADRLAQPEGQWRRFDRAAHGAVRRMLYQDPGRAPRMGNLFGLY